MIRRIEMPEGLTSSEKLELALKLVRSAQQDCPMSSYIFANGFLQTAIMAIKFAIGKAGVDNRSLFRWASENTEGILSERKDWLR